MKLLQVPTAELEQRIKEEIEENPALEESSDEEDGSETDEDAYGESEEEGGEDQEDLDLTEYMEDDDLTDLQAIPQTKGEDEDEREVPVTNDRSFHEHLIAQLQLKPLSDHEMMVARHIVGSLDNAGYLTRNTEDIVDDIAFSNNIETTEDTVEKVLEEVKTLDPAGVGARDLRECLLLQIRRKAMDGREDRQIAEKILEDHFEAFTKKHYGQIQKKLQISDEQFKAALDEITRLDPKPGDSQRETTHTTQTVTPDFIITLQNGELDLTLNNSNAPDLRVSPAYSRMLEEYAAKKNDPQQKEAFTFVKQKLDSAKWFIDAIRQRQQTLMLTMRAIMEYQRDYFQTGDEGKLKPMILKDIAESVGLDISTISRVVNSKYVQTPYGTFSLKSFFSEAITTESGDEVSSRKVKKILWDWIQNEDKSKPLTDQKLADILREEGYNIARRTVAKYREQMKIPVARLRKEL